ncbi:MAG: DUF3488 and transglutaminase-like domain-containing protein, partial [Chloroflexota bacterium]|nr:DUF3488 and transglutaminase-like domain-containing protein [Chloroflexota bacterium]
LLLMIRFNLLTKEERWRQERVNYSPRITWSFLWAGSVVSVLLALLMWFVPATPVNATLNSMWAKVNGPWNDFQNSMSRLWSEVPGNQAIGGYSSFNKQFTMGGSLNLSDSVALRVQSSERHYWRAMTYDQYTGSTWKNTAADTFSVENLSPRLALDANQQLVSTDEARRSVTYTIEVVNPKFDTVFASSRPVRLSQPTRLEVSWRKLDSNYTVDQIYDAGGGSDFTGVPLELHLLLGRLHEAELEMHKALPGKPGLSGLDFLLATSKRGEILDEQLKLAGRGITVRFEVGNAPNYAVSVSATGQVPVYDDISAIHSVNNMSRGDKYSVASMISTADESSLRAVTGPYDGWLRDRYLQLPANLSPAIAALTNKIVLDAGATNPYDEGKAIEAYLRTNYKYSVNIPSPPAGAERVEWFLFHLKEGYCEYYATSFIVMMRTLGIPTRMATGYAPGTLDPASQQYVVKESAAHAWPEVYFPGYGWIEFEPTPSQAVISREADQKTEPVQPTAEPTSLITPTVGKPSQRNLNDTQNTPVSGSTNPRGDGGLGGASIVLAVVLVLSFVGLTTLVLLRRRNRAPLSAIAIYGRMVTWSGLLRLRPVDGQTPYEFSENLGREVPGTALFARTVSRAYVREQFSKQSLETSERVAARRAWDSLRGRLLRSLPAREFGRRRRNRP